MSALCPSCRWKMSYLLLNGSTTSILLVTCDFISLILSIRKSSYLFFGVIKSLYPLIFGANFADSTGFATIACWTACRSKLWLIKGLPDKSMVKRVIDFLRHGLIISNIGELRLQWDKSRLANCLLYLMKLAMSVAALICSSRMVSEVFLAVGKSASLFHDKLTSTNDRLLAKHSNIGLNWLWSSWVHEISRIFNPLLSSIILTSKPTIWLFIWVFCRVSSVSFLVLHRSWKRRDVTDKLIWQSDKTSVLN